MIGRQKTYRVQLTDDEKKRLHQQAIARKTGQSTVKRAKPIAQHFDVGDKKQIVLALDQAGWHTAKKLDIPQGIHIVEMPSHSPELQPAERLWPLTNEPIAFPFI